MEIELNDKIIPYIVNKICGEYYLCEIEDDWDEEIFDNVSNKRDRYIEYSQNKTARNTYGGFNAVYLREVAKDGVHEWKFKIIGAQGIGVLIGIKAVNNKEQKMPKSYPFTINFDHELEEKNGYAFSERTGKLQSKRLTRGEKYGCKCKDGDIIEMRLDFNNKTLGYIINDKDYGKAFDIDATKMYRAAVRLGASNSSIQFLEHIM